MPKLESGEVRLAVGDELRLKLNGGGFKGGDWDGVGNVIKIPNSSSRDDQRIHGSRSC